MARVNIDILGISKLKRTGMGEFNSDDIISTTVSKNPLKESSHRGQQKSLKCSTWTQSQKQHDDLCLPLWQAIQYHSNPSLCLDQ